MDIVEILLILSWTSSFGVQEPLTRPFNITGFCRSTIGKLGKVIDCNNNYDQFNDIEEYKNEKKHQWHKLQKRNALKNFFTSRPSRKQMKGPKEDESAPEDDDDQSDLSDKDGTDNDDEEDAKDAPKEAEGSPGAPKEVAGSPGAPKEVVPAPGAPKEVVPAPEAPKEAPEKVEKPEPAPPAKKWVTPEVFATLPSNAFHAGTDFDGMKMYIGKGKIPNERAIVPGRLSELHNSCVEVAWRGWGRCLRHFEVLVGDTYKWVLSRGRVTRSDAVKAGYEENQPLYICCYYLNEHNVTNHLLIGKVTAPGLCYVSHAGHERFFINHYYLLTEKKQKKKKKT